MGDISEHHQPLACGGTVSSYFGAMKQQASIWPGTRLPSYTLCSHTRGSRLHQGTPCEEEKTRPGRGGGGHCWNTCGGWGEVSRATLISAGHGHRRKVRQAEGYSEECVRV